MQTFLYLEKCHVQPVVPVRASVGLFPKTPGPALGPGPALAPGLAPGPALAPGPEVEWDGEGDGEGEGEGDGEGEGESWKIQRGRFVEHGG